MDAETLPSGIGKQDVTVTSLGLTQPRLQDDQGRLGDGRTAFFASLSDYPHVRTGPLDDVLTLKSGHLREAQTRLYRQQNEGVIAAA